MIAGDPRIQIRDLPRVRAATARYHGSPHGLGAAMEALEDWVRIRGLFPAGPLVVEFRELAAPVETGPLLPPVEARLVVPMTDLRPDGSGVECAVLPSIQAACLMYQGAMDAEFRAAHEQLFAWMDARGLRHEGTVHHHAYIKSGQGLEHWIVEIRVPIEPAA